MTSTVSEKGQVTIPKKIRDRLGLKPGTVLEFREKGGKLIATKAEARDPVDAVYGKLDLGSSTDEFVDQIRGSADV